MAKWQFTEDKAKDAPPGVVRTTFHEDGRKVVGYACNGVRLKDGDWVDFGRVLEDKPTEPAEKPRLSPPKMFSKKGK